MDGQAEKEHQLNVSPLETLDQSDKAGQERKRREIRHACEEGNVENLVDLADSNGGLLDDTLRELAWPILLAGSRRVANSNTLGTPWQTRPAHREEEQVQRDVDRAFVYYANDAPDAVMEARKKQLFNLIVGTLRSHPMLCYFQGYHDIAQVMMLVLGPVKAAEAMEILSLCRIRDYMLPTLTPALKHLQLLPAILKAADSNLAAHLTLPNSNYALPSALTLYAHVIQEYRDIARMFDFLLGHEPVISIYLFAATILSRRESLLEIPSDEQDMLFFTLQKLPQPLNLEPLIEEALRLFRRYPPEVLDGGVWRRISSNSVLKTARSIEEPQDLKSAEESFQKQVLEIKWEERRRKVLLQAWNHRRPIKWTALALGVGALAVWLRKSGNERVLTTLVLSMIGMNN